MVQVPVEPVITEFLHRKASAARIPLNGTFELTPVCNMNCRMCYVRMSKSEQESIQPLRTAEEWIRLGQSARDAGMLYLLLTGGEPFSHPQFREILSGLHKLGLIISINTNGTLIDETVISWLKECPPAKINITLYGSSNETYSRLCGNPNGYTQTVRAIRLLKEAGFNVKLNCSLTPHNTEDLEDIFQFANDEGLVIQATSYMFPPMRRDPAMIGINERFSPEDAAYYAAKIDYLRAGRAYLLSMEEDDYSSLHTEVDDSCDMEGDKMRCRAGICSFWITWKGDFLPCGMIPSDQALNVFSAGFEKSWQRAREIVDDIRLPAKCHSCALQQKCKACAAMVMTESGTFDKAPDYRCRMMQEFPVQRRRLIDELSKADCGLDPVES